MEVKRLEEKEEGMREEGKSIDSRGRFLRIQGNRFRDRKGAALIALPARSRGLGTILFLFLFPLCRFLSYTPLPILFLSSGHLFSPNSIFRL